MKHLITTLLLTLICLSTNAQLNLNDSIAYIHNANADYAGILRYAKMAMNFDRNIPQEKAYLHLDNTGYFKGEHIWFKAYVVRASDNLPTEISRVLYAELVDPAGTVVQTKKVYIEEGTGEGFFALDSILATGFYEVRAYTRYMLNWGSTGIYSRVIPIFKQPKKDGDYSTPTIDKYSYKARLYDNRKVPEEILDEAKYNEKYGTYKLKRLPVGKVHVNLYPEGGNLVEDIPGRVAFTVNDSEGRDFDCEGTIVNEDNEVQQAVVTIKEGKGFFDIIPTMDPLYLKLTTKDGKYQIFELPEVNPEGTSVMLNTLNDDKVTATLRSSPAMQGTLMGYALIHGGRIVMCDTIRTRKQLTLEFDRGELPHGVNQLTLFDSHGNIHAERLFFICPPNSQPDSISVTTRQDKLAPCGKVTLDIHTRPNATLSLSAMDVATLTNGKEGNAQTWMLLGSELKGYIHNPDYYFEADDRTHRVDADLLMLTQGWRRYDLEQMTSDVPFEDIQYIEDSLYIYGTVLDKWKDRVKDSIRLNVWLYNQYGDWLKGETITDTVGYYAFRLPNMSGDWNMLMKTKENDQDKTMRVTINRNFSPQPRWLSPYETEALEPLQSNLFTDVPDSAYTELEDLPILKRENVLPNIKVKARRRIYDNARAAWESDKQARLYATTYYDMVAETDRCHDEGERLPSVYEWLYTHNSMFSTGQYGHFMPKAMSADSKDLRKKKKTYADVKNQHNASMTKNSSASSTDADRIPLSGFDFTSDNFQPTNDPYYTSNSYTHNGISTTLEYSLSNGARTAPTFDEPLGTEEPEYYDDGLYYDGRPVVWILNNCFYGITGLNGARITDIHIKEDNRLDIMPTSIDEVKSIFISEDSKAGNRYAYSSRLSSRHPAVVFVYTFHTFWRNVKGLVRTHYHAFDEPETFQMDDYSVLPPMEDFRRTIYWAPTVKTDDKGNATVEFWNNSSARKLYISAEGITKDGHILVNE